MPSRTTLASALLGLALICPGAFADDRRAVPDPTPWMGVLLGDAVDGGVQVVAVLPGGPAERASLQRGDLILEAEGRTVPAQAMLRELLSERRPGDTLDLMVIRAGERRSLRIELGERGKPAAPRAPEPIVPWSSVPRVSVAPPVARFAPRAVGIEAVEITPGLREHYGAPGDRGVLVLRTAPGMLADQAGLRVGDVVLELGGKRMLSGVELEATLRAWRAEQPLQAVVVRDGTVQGLTIEPTAATREQARQRLSTDEQQRRQAVRRRIELEIEALERRIESLRQELRSLEPQQEP